MPDKTVRKASVTIQSPGGEASAEGITFIAAVNSAPTVEVVLRRAKAKVVKPLTAEVLAAMKAIQTSRFELKGSPDTTIVAEDGNGGKLTFKGYSVAPVLEQSTISSAETVNVVGEDAFLNGLGLSIYQSRPNEVRKEETTKLFKKTPSRTTGDIAKLIQEVTDVLVSNLDATVQEARTDSNKKVIKLKHAANEPALAVWKKILGNSDVRYPEWQELLTTKAPKLGESVAERTKQLLQQRTSSFWDIVNGLGAEFMFFYRPSVDGTSGRLVRSDKKVVDEAAKNFDAGVTRFTATDGSPSMLPLSGVILYGPALPGLRKEGQPYSAGAVVGQYPVEITAGYFHEGAPPAWLNAGGYEAFATKKVMTPATPSSAGEKKNFDPSGYTQRSTGMEEHLEQVGTKLSKILQAYAKVMYDDMRLADSTATLEIPLDFTIQVGIRYTFKMGGEDGGQFTAFVRALRHSLQLQGGQQLASGTVLTLTHVIYT